MKSAEIREKIKAEKPVLFVITSSSHPANSRQKTGFTFEEVATPYYILQEAGLMVDLLSLEGGSPHPDPASYDKENEHNNPESVNRFVQDPEAMYKLQNTLKLKKCKAADFHALFLAGGHGALWDFPGDKDLQGLISSAYRQKKIIASISQGAAALVNVETNGEFIVKGHKITASTNDEEYAAHKQNLLPFMLENRLRARGALFEQGKRWEPYIAEDETFLSGQNPASSDLIGEALRERILKKLNKMAA